MHLDSAHGDTGRRSRRLRRLSSEKSRIPGIVREARRQIDLRPEPAQAGRRRKAVVTIRTQGTMPPCARRSSSIPPSATRPSVQFQPLWDTVTRDGKLTFPARRRCSGDRDHRPRRGLSPDVLLRPGAREARRRLRRPRASDLVAWACVSPLDHDHRPGEYPRLQRQALHFPPDDGRHGSGDRLDRRQMGRPRFIEAGGNRDAPHRIKGWKVTNYLPAEGHGAWGCSSSPTFGLRRSTDLQNSRKRALALVERALVGEGAAME